MGRPDSTDPEIVSAYVLSRFDQPDDQVRDLITRAADETERLIRQIAGAGDEAGRCLRRWRRKPDGPGGEAEEPSE